MPRIPVSREERIPEKLTQYEKLKILETIMENDLSIKGPREKESFEGDTRDGMQQREVRPAYHNKRTKAYQED